MPDEFDSAGWIGGEGGLLVGSGAAGSDRPQGEPVSSRFRLPAGAPSALRAALEAADGVHGVPAWAPVTRVTLSGLGRAFGAYRAATNGGPELVMDPGAPLPGLVMAHEIGHYVLAELLGLVAEEEVQRGPALEPWRAAVGATDAVRRLRDQQQRAQDALAGRTPTPHATQTLLAILASSTYDLRESELFARSYTQLIVRSGGSAELAEQLESALARSRQGPVYLRLQWEAADFRPVADALEALLWHQGWTR